MRQILIIEHAPERADGFLNCIRQHSFAVEPVVWKCYQAERCPEIDFAGLIIGGGPMMVSDLMAGKHPFFTVECDLISAAATRKIPILGVCLGSQILCSLFGGQVEPGDWVVGWHSVRPVQVHNNDPLFDGVQKPFTTFQYHRDHLKVLPPGAICLAASDTTEVEAFQLPDNIWACLFHPEVEVEQILAVHDTIPGAFGSHFRSRDDLVPYDDGQLSRHSILGNFFRIVTR